MFRQIVIFAAIFVVAAATSAVEREGRIVGGVDNVVGQVPWGVSLRTLAGAHFCTGSVVNNWWIITAGHCVFGRGASSIGMLLGRVTLDGTGGIQRQSFRIVTHPDFNAGNMLFDLGLVQVSVFISFSANVQSIFLANTFTPGGVHAKVSGWGSTSTNLGPTSNNLRTLDTTTLDTITCQERHSTANAARITSHHLCTDNPFGQGFCQAGAGGPLVWNSQLIGIASWNIPCALGFPDVYVRISELRPWIESIIQ